MIKNVRFVELNVTIVTDFLNREILKMIQQNKNIFVVTKIINTC